jgi:hypothetical protein
VVASLVWNVVGVTSAALVAVLLGALLLGAVVVGFVLVGGVLRVVLGTLDNVSDERDGVRVGVGVLAGACGGAVGAGMAVWGARRGAHRHTRLTLARAVTAADAYTELLPVGVATVVIGADVVSHVQSVATACGVAAPWLPAGRARAWTLV